MSTRDKLTLELYKAMDAAWSDETEFDGAPVKIAYHLLSQGWRPPMRVIETVEELEALPDRAIIFDKNGDVYERRKNEWENIYISPIYADEDSPAEIHPRGPFRVVWEPEEKE